MNERCVPPTSTVRFSLPLISVEAVQLPLLAPVVLVPVVEPPAPPVLEALLVGPPPEPPAPATPVVDVAPLVAPPTLVFVASAVVADAVDALLVLATDVACPVVDVVVTLVEEVVVDAVELVWSPVELIVLVALLSEFAASLLQARAL